MKKLLALFVILIILGCAKESQKAYILFEKQLADITGSRNLQVAKENVRHRTTAKIVIKNVGAQFIEPALKQALSDIQKDDPSLDAVIIWAYKDRSELNQSFTLGKLEWSKDKRGWDGKQKHNNEILIETK